MQPVLLDQQEVEECPSQEICTCSHLRNIKRLLPHERATVSTGKSGIPPLTPADRKRKQRCLQGDEKRELDKIQTYVRVQKLREAQTEADREAERTQTQVRVHKLREGQAEADREVERTQTQVRMQKLREAQTEADLEEQRTQTQVRMQKLREAQTIALDNKNPTYQKFIFLHTGKFTIQYVILIFRTDYQDLIFLNCAMP